MRISSLEEYGLRCALQLAKARDKGEPLSASQVAEKEGLSVEYVSKIMHLFRKGGLVTSTRGIQGGFTLTKDAEKINVKEVLDIVLNSQKSAESLDEFCKQHSGTEKECVHCATCTIRPVWALIFEVFDRVLSGITLADLGNKSADLVQKIRSLSGVAFVAAPKERLL